MPTWLGWLSIALAIIAIVSAITASSAVATLLGGVWVLITSVVLYRRSGTSSQGSEIQGVANSAIPPSGLPSYWPSSTLSLVSRSETQELIANHTDLVKYRASDESFRGLCGAGATRGSRSRRGSWMGSHDGEGVCPMDVISTARVVRSAGGR